jgi:hypothetical protein
MTITIGRSFIFGALLGSQAAHSPITQENVQTRDRKQCDQPGRRNSDAAEDSMAPRASACFSSDHSAAGPARCHSGHNAPAPTAIRSPDHVTAFASTLSGLPIDCNWQVAGGPIRRAGCKDCGGDCNSRSRLGKPTQAFDANVSIFDRMTDDEQRALLAALLRLSGVPSGENLT